jgi:hypothetical protein
MGAHWQPAIEIARRAAVELQQLGYFGPLGIDAARYRNQDGDLCLRPLQDINARYTFGRLSLGWRRWLQPGECGSWLHLPLRDRDNVASLDELESRLRDCLPPGCRLLCTSPLEVGHKLATSHSLLVTAPAIEVLVEAELRFMQRLGHESSYP